MHFTQLLPLLAFLGVETALAQITATSTPTVSQASKLFSDLSAFESSLATQSAYTSIYLELLSASASPTGLPAFYVSDGDFSLLTSEVNNAITGVFSGQENYPTDVVEYVKSELAAEASIYNQDVGGTNAAPGGLKMSVIVLGVAVVGGVGALIAL